MEDKDIIIPKSEWRNIPTPFKGETCESDLEKEYIEFYMDHYDETKLEEQGVYIRQLQNDFYDRISRKEIVDILNNEPDYFSVERCPEVEGPLDKWVEDDLVMILPLVMFYEIFYQVIYNQYRVKRVNRTKRPFLYKQKRIFVDAYSVFYPKWSE